MYIENILNSNSYASGVITLRVPDASGNQSYHEIRGLLDGDVSFKMSNSWGSIAPNLSSLSDLTQIINNQSILSWVSSSTGAWKGTEPLTIDITFYLVTYKYGQSPSIKQQAAYLAKLNTLYVENNFATVKVHGGYKLNLMDSNADNVDKYFMKGEEINKEHVAQLVNDEETNGLISISIGDSLTLDKLLLKEIDINPSAVQVSSGVPLYIKINASFRTFRSMIASDIDRFFGLGSSTGVEE